MNPSENTERENRIIDVFDNQFPRGEVWEGRVIGDRNGCKIISSGYFNDPKAFAKEVLRKDANYGLPGNGSIYFTLNPVDPSYLNVREPNRIHDGVKDTTPDTAIIRRKRILLDFDYARPKEMAKSISSTQEELDEIWEAYCAAMEWLKNAYGIVPASKFMSGNGYHGILNTDLPNNPASTALVQAFIRGLAARFDTNRVHIDQVVYNAARISKVPETTARKGYSSPDRPHRRAKTFEHNPNEPAVSEEMLREITKECGIVCLESSSTEGESGTSSSALPPSGGGASPVGNNRSSSGHIIDVEKLLQDKSVAITAIKHRPDGSTVYVLEHCLFNPEHRSSSAAIIRGNQGGLGYKCHHSSCSGKKWRDVHGALGLEPPRRRRRGRPSGGQKEQESPSSAIVRLVEEGEAELFKSEDGMDEAGYISFTAETNGRKHRETWRIGSKGFKNWLSKHAYEKLEKLPSEQAFKDATNVLRGKALFDGKVCPVGLRVARHSGRLYLDLCDDEWGVVEADCNGWRVIPAALCPVRFIRSKGMLALPRPVPGGNLLDIRSLLNLEDDGQFHKLVAWLMGTLRGKGPYPVLVAEGEQGSAKTTLCRMTRGTVDPNAVPLSSPPRDDRDLMIAASNSYCVGFDNMSGISSRLSDSLCSLATTAGFRTRALFEDGEEHLISVSRPIVVNGIGDSITRPDLLDRMIRIQLPAIPPEKRKTEAELWTRFEELHPGLLGCLLDGVSSALDNFDKVHLPNPPRMADFAHWVTAAEPGLGLPPGTLLSACSADQAAIDELAIDASPIGAAVTRFARTWRRWDGTASELLDKLNSDEFLYASGRRESGWPQRANTLSSSLKRIAQNLRRQGIDVDFHRVGHAGRKTIRIRLLPDPPAEASSREPLAENPSPPEGELDPADDHACADDQAGNADDAPSTAKTGFPGPENSVSGVADDADDEIGTTQDNCAQRLSGSPLGGLDPDRPGALDALSLDQLERYQEARAGLPTDDPAAAHAEAWRAALNPRKEPQWRRN